MMADTRVPGVIRMEQDIRTEQDGRHRWCCDRLGLWITLSRLLTTEQLRSQISLAEGNCSVERNVLTTEPTTYCQDALEMKMGPCSIQQSHYQIWTSQQTAPSEALS